MIKDKILAHVRAHNEIVANIYGEGRVTDLSHLKVGPGGKREFNFYLPLTDEFLAEKTEEQVLFALTLVLQADLLTIKAVKEVEGDLLLDQRGLNIQTEDGQIKGLIRHYAPENSVIFLEPKKEDLDKPKIIRL